MSNSAIIHSQIVSEVYSQSQTLIELLRLRTFQQPDQLAYTFLVDEGVVETTLTYGELDQRARSIAARLQSIVEVGDRVLLLYPPGLEYIAAFFGCLYAGAIAVPAYPPRNNRNLHRLQTLVQNAEAAVSLTTSPILSRIAPHVSQNSYLAPLVWQATDQIPDWVANDWREPSISGDSLAFLQYTSGSTSAPKGVMVNHHNLLHNERLIQSVFQQTDQSVIVGWLPLYHDMGLIGNVIQPLFVGAPCILMSPMAFLQKPFRWLEAISRYRATTSGGPNFAYDLCVRKINDEQRATLDLSSWQVAFNGAEPVRQETLERFAAAFAPCGFEFDAFRPCYGLAEATLLVSGRTGNEPLVATTIQAGALEAGHAIKTTSAVDAYTLVNCGGALAQDKVVIVDPRTLTECAPGAVGEIWVAGPGVAQGYWNDPAETDRIFRAYLPERSEGPFLRTEDLGFLLDGKLFVTGRLKDLIIIRGLNHYPQDIELTVERCHTALRPGCCAAFSVDVAGEERLVIVQEVDQRRQFRAETVIESINEAVAREHELQAHAIVLVTPGTVPKTSSGKIQRYACREAFLRGALEVVAEQRGIEYRPAKLEDELAIPDRHDRQAIELWLRAQAAGKLNVDLQQVDVTQPLTRYGLDSLAAIELAHWIENNFDIAVPLTAFLEGTSIAELTTRVVDQQQVNSGERRRPAGEPIARTSAPLSVGQRALWFLHQVDPESAAYNLAGAVRVLSQLDVPALQRAFQQLVKRHVSLRTTFPSRDGEPAVSVHEDVEVDFIVHDSSAWDDAAVSQYLTDEAHRPFDLEAGPLLRVRLLSRSGQEQVLLLCVHHIVADQWSLAVLLNELGVLYEAECTGALVTLPELRSQYADYARWQDKLLSGESGERLLSYWKKQLAGELPNLNLPTDRPYPPVQTYHGASHLFRLNADLTRSLKEVSCARDATLYMTLLAAFQVLLHGYTDQEDILIGSPAAGRSLAEFANVVGYFVNPLVIRADLAGNSTFEAVLSRTRQTVLEAFEHQDYPFPLLTVRLQPARDASRSPIFQVMFSMQNTPLGSAGGLTALAVGEPGAKLQLGNLHLESLPLEQQAAMFDITLRMAEVEGELLASLQYNTDLFDPATITRMAEHFQTLLDGIVSDPSRPLSELPLLTRAESRLLAEWNKTDRDYAQPYCLHELFEQQVERSPEAVALVFEDKQLDYAELNELANQLAGRLQQFGIKPETRIGLCVERSFEMVIGLLGILKAGGAYVPLNPSDPPERLSFMCADAGAQVLLTQKRFGHLLPANGAHVIYLDEPYSEKASETTGPTPGSGVDVCPENLAYVIYTSGSTGQPKGAMNTHKAVVNRLLWMQEAYRLGPADCVLQKTPFTFDVSVWEFFWPLLAGARLVLARPGGHQDPPYLARLISAEQVTTLHFVPSMLQVFLDEPEVRHCHSLKRVICSGEALPLALQERFFELCEAELHNLYGPTEAAVDVTFWACERDSERLTVPIGRPIANTQIHLLDGHLRQTPVGVVGELYIGGTAVGRGYCDRPELTAERFIPDPIGAAGARLYKTGDLARYLADGSIEYLGRVDHQVKLHGLRIELGEIEAALMQHAAVHEAVVVVREFGPGNQRLVAYLAPDTGVSELRKDFERYLRERLPSYMVPSMFVFLDKLPITSSGKVNRRALPAPKQELAENFVEPRNQAEQTLAEIWTNVLQIEKVGIHDNFFALGGDSILGIQIVARANRAGLDLAPRQLFQYQTVAQLAAVAGTSQRLQAEQIAITGAVPLTPVQHWFFEHDLPNPHHWNQSVLLQMRRAIDPVLLERVFRHLFAHHDALRLRFTCSESVWTQFNAATEDALPFSVRDLSPLSDCEQEAAVAAAAAELQTSLNISTGPVLRAAYFDLGPDKPGKLLLVIHHLVVDGISWRILLEDLQLAYEQLSRDEIVSLPSKTTSFKAWAKGLSEYALSEVVEQESAHWLTALPQQPGHLPIDFQGGPNNEASARIVSATLGSKETHALLHDVPSAYRSYINELLLAALAWSFSQETDESSLLIDLEGHGREELVAGADISRTVGWFTAIYPVLLKLENSSTPATMLALVKEQLRQIPNHGAGYGVARYLRNDNENAARLRVLPQPEVSFNYLGQLDSAFAGDGLFAGAQEIESGLRNPQGQRRYLLEINAGIINRRLKLNWIYSQSAHHQSTIERLAQNFLKALQAIITGSESHEVPRLTPADFPLSKLNQSRLAQLCETFGDPEEIYPLAPVQEGLLFHSFYETRSGVYVEQLSLTLRGKLNVSAFERAWQKVSDRHAILRTAFVWENLEQPLQVVSRDVVLRVATEDWRGISASEQAQRFESFLQADRKQNFDLQAAPLMRLALFRVADDVYRFVWSHHHLLLDGWSLPIVLNEVFTFYEQFSEGRELPLKPAPQYWNFITWLKQQDSTASEAFWRQTLADFSAPTPLTLDRRQEGVTDQSDLYGESHAHLSQATTTALQSFARRHHLTLHTVLQGAWALLLSRYSGAEDVVFGTIVSGRPGSLLEIQETVGIFINTLPVRIQVPFDGLLPAWLHELQNKQAELGKHEHTPLIQIQGWSEVPRGTPLFESVLSFLNYPITSALQQSHKDLHVEEVSWFEQTHYPLTMQVTPGSELLLKAIYDPQRFDAQTGERILGHFQTLLETIAAQPAARLSTISVLTEEEEQQLAEWNNTTREYPRDTCIHQLFEAQVERTPDAVAVSLGEEEISYRELNRRANQVAHYLRSLGVGPEVCVGVCLERSVDLVVALVAILKAGGAYVPLDTSYPLERLAFMLEDAQIGILVTTEKLMELLPAHWAQVLCLDTDAELIGSMSEQNLGSEVSAENLAYVMYTSGSTGQPKGVSVIQRSVVRLVKETNYIEIFESDVFLQSAPIAFDASTFEVWGSLLNGARLVLLEQQRPTVEELARASSSNGVTVLWLTAGLFHLLVDEAGWALLGVRRMLAGGDVLAVEQVRKYLAQLGPGNRLLNGYGPTENTTFTCCHTMERESRWVGTVPIGKPITNTTVYILDREQRVVPVGVYGEIYAGGDGLARGYLNGPELTAEKFVPHPFSERAGERLYRTGDVGRWLPDGSIEYLGRLDEQVKLRGFRIELGEIEAVLSRHEGVREAVVVVQTVNHDQRLVAYVVGEESLQSGELRQYLKSVLPEYMVPQVLVQLERLPLTENGKVDRRALPAVENVREETEMVLAQTPVEEVLAGIWSEVLGVRVGVEDDFFELGGHSLLATQVMSRVQEAFGVEVGLRELFERPTVRELGQSIERELRQGAGVGAPPITSVDRDRELPLSFAQQRLWFIDQMEPGSAFYNVPVAIKLTGALDVEALERTLTEIVRRHEVLRTSFASEDGRAVQIIHPVDPVKLPLIELSHLRAEEREEKVRQSAQAEAAQPFDLSHGPLLRAQLLRLSQSEHVFLFTMHHIVSDGWSIALLIKEVGALYTAFSAGEPSPLEELSIQYADFAVWQREYLQGDRLEQQLAYWRRQLHAAPTVLNLPIDHLRPAVQGHSGALHRFVLSAELSESLKELSRRKGVTLYMTLLAAFSNLLQRYTQAEELLIGTPIAGRNHREIEQLIGIFVNTLVLRVDLSSDPSFHELLGRVRRVCLEAHAHQDVPFEKLIEELQPERSLSHTPFFQVMFGLQNTPQEELKLPGLRLNQIEIRREVATFDLVLDLRESTTGIEGFFEYNTHVFESATIERMATHLITLLEAIVADPEQRLSTLPLLTAAEEQQLKEWNPPCGEYPREHCLQQLFEAQVERAPEAPALVCNEDSLSYGELNSRANQLAHHLQRMGVGPETVVGIMMERSIEMMCSVLAVLKAGGAYLPLDLSFPSERLSYMLRDAGIKVLIGQRRFAGESPVPDAQVVLLDDAWNFAENSTSNPQVEMSPGNLAYVIYTSGSTGQPKATLVPHSAVVSSNWAVIERYELGPTDRVLQFASLSFDVSVEEIFPTWLSGGCVVLRPDGLLDSHAHFWDFLTRARISVVNLPTAYWSELIAARRQSEAGELSLRLVAIGEELVERFALTQEVVGPDVRLFNVYGLTETTVTTMTQDFGALESGARSVPLGKPIANSQMYVLDRQQRVAPVGVSGELYIGGNGLARGYLNRPELTAERFVPHPFSEREGERLYRTGDVGRWLSDGKIEFLGRVDHQVKLRGFRIELGEIEAVLSRHEGVREAVVVVQTVNHDHRLVAYVVGEESLQSGELRQYLKSVLPEYMVPQVLVQLERLPLTENGKVDRRALPAVENVREETEMVLAQTPVEEVLAGIWSEVLGVRVGVEDDFFELGGHSLLATQVISRAREAFGVEVELRELFERPTVRELGQSIERELRQGTGVSAPPLERRERVGELPLSFAQQRLWFIDQLEPGGAFYNVPAAVRLKGRLNQEALAQTLSEVIRRHEVLRTRFATVEGRAVQVIEAAAPVELAVVELSELEVSEREARVREWAAQEAATPFDLSRGPLLRMKLLRLGEQEHVVLLTMHHIVSDGWSVGVLIKEVGTLYAAYVAGQESPLEELRIQYADFALWQRAYLQGEVLEQQLKYWREQLAGAETVLKLATDKPRPAIYSYRGATHKFVLPTTVTAPLRKLSQEQGCTLFMTLLASFKTLLYRYTEQEDILVGTAIANRNRSETEALIGFFVNTLVLRTDLSGNPSFRELMQRVRETTIGAYAHQDMPFERLVEELQPERSLSHTPIFQILFALQNAWVDELGLPGLNLTVLQTEHATSKFDLSLVMAEEAGELRGALEYNSDLFDPATITRMAEHFQTLLDGIVTDPSRPLSELPLLTSAESRLLAEWNKTDRDYAQPYCLHELFEQQVERSPEAVALVFGDKQLDYAELNELANQLASRLQQSGTKPETRIGLCVERSFEMVIGLLGILKAGGAYVPLNPSDPPERLSFMCADAGAQVLLTQKRFGHLLPANGAHVIYLDEPYSETASETISPTPGSSVAVCPENLAYVIYTSGSTGQPKGAMNTHKAVVNRLLWMQEAYGLGPGDCVLQKTPFTFDVSVWEFFWPLLAGARLVLARPGGHQDPPYLARLISAEQVTTLHFVPSMLQVFLDEPEVRHCHSLKRVICSGEALPLALQERFFELCDAELHNLYGPTEAAVDVTFWACERESERLTVPIGRPIANTQIHLLDRHLRQTPVGVVGELYIGGTAVGRGYCDRPELTAERFIPDPIGAAGARLYKTGDLARYLADGSIEYLGRVDHQVKLRGLRIEVGEIEAVLAQHAAVHEAVVVVKEYGPGDQRLVAYVVGEESLESGELRQYLKSVLPEYMVPQVLVKLERLPLTENGKVDRRALPAVENVREETEIVAAQTPVEEVLAGIWSEVLGVRVGVEDDFFDLGGHSLLATQVMSRVREAFGVEVRLRELFERPTVRELGQSIERELRQGAGVGAPPIERREREGALPLSFAQQRLWFIDQLAPGGTVYNIPVSVRLSGALNVMALEQTLNEIIRRHEVLRTSFAVVDEQPVQVIAPAVSLSLTVQELTSLPEPEREAEVSRLADAEAHQPFDLSQGPLLRVQLLRLSESEHVVLLTMHHIITDGWSLGVLISEVAVLYRAFAQGEAAPLPELPVQYADFALWQRERLQGEELERQLGYWRQQLADAPALLKLPTDRPRAALPTFNGADEAFTLSAESTQALHRLSRSRDVTLFMTLLAVWQVLLHRYSGQQDIVVGADVANRNRVETERLIGFFVNMLVLRTDHSGDPTFLELLKRVKEVCLGAYAHQDLPFEKLVEELQPERSLNHSPLFQVVFVLQNAPMGALELPGLVLSMVEPKRDETQFDLILNMQEAEGKLYGTLRYNTDLFEAETIKRMLGHFQTLLAAVIADPAQPLSTLPLLTEEEEQQLAEWNNTTREYPRTACIHELFEEQVERTPDAVAVSFGEQGISYRALNTRANQVAHYLRSLGVGPEVCVGVCLERSVDLVVALVAILKAGGAYVPLDTSYPLERLAFMLEDAQIGILVTTEKLMELLPAHWAQVLCLDTDAELIGSMSEQNLGSEVSGENLAYVMYTSGSTGQPKGVSVIQRSVVRLVKETNYIEISASDVFLQSAPIAFDASTFEVWGSLLNGARLVLLEQQRPTVEELARAISSNGVTVLWLTAGLFHLLVDEAGWALLGVRRMLAGGDVLAVEQVRKYLAQLGPGKRLLNGYGPTENTTFTCCHTMERESCWVGSVPIGKPISNTTVYILDGQQRVAPVGVYGEIYAGGDGLARGYLNGPELTAEKFVPHPFSEREGERLYRTGDVGRWLPDGSIEYLGRLDEQVKLRGFRIELGEIEAVLSRHEGVREAVVVVQTMNHDQRLVAYVVGEESLQSGELRQYLKSVLPEYMVPQVLVKLERLPLTENGKVDRRALPEVENVREETEMVLAQTPVEEVLAGIWSEVLGVRVGVEDDFFELGGHSLLATQVMSRVQEAFGVEVGLRELFERPTVKELAQSIERELRQGAGVSAPPIERRERIGALPLSFAQQRLYFFDQLKPGSAFYNVPAAVRLKGRLNKEALEQTLTEVIRRHEVLRTRFDTVDGRAVQVIEAAAPVELAVVELSELEAAEREARVREWAAQEAATPFDLSRGPLLRVQLLRLGEQEHVVLLTMHHIVMDGWSLGIFIREIATLYEAFIEGRLSPLPELSIQYADFALWQRAYLQGEVLEQQLKYWREQLAGAETVLKLVTDKPRPAIYSYRGATHKFVLPTAVTAPLRKLSQEQGCTLFMTLLASFKTLLYRYTGQEDILVGTAIANRNRSETEDLIGFFVNTLVLRTDLSGNPSFRKLMQRVRETTIGAYVHQDMPFEKLVEELQPERSLSQAPLFQVAFGVHNTPVQTLSLPGLELSPMDFDFDVGRFDLTLWMSEYQDELTGVWSYNTDLFEGATIKRMQGHLETILQNVLAQPDLPLSEIEMLTEDEKKQQLVQEQERLESNARVLRTIRRKGISMPQATAAQTELN